MKEYIVAIDLGTSCTAFSWKSISDPQPCVGVPDMQPGDEITCKSPTCLLVGGTMSPDKEFRASTSIESYGRVAKTRYKTNDYPHGAQLSERFKMEVHGNQARNKTFDDLLGAVTKSFSKQAELGLDEVFALALKHTKEVALQSLTVTQAPAASDVEWVLTVPVCCTNQAKHFMRHVAQKAGLLRGEGDDESLTLCLEPIAACLALEKKLSWRIYDTYMVIDCGGGTVDISAFQLSSVDPSKLDQLGGVGGGPWGATEVDKLFEQFFKGFLYNVAPDVSPKAMKSFLASSTYFRIMQAWERAKVNMRNVNDNCRVDISELSSSVLEVDMAALDNARTQMNAEGEDLVGGNRTWDLLLRPTLMRRFFQLSCDSIQTAVREQLDQEGLQNLTAVVMVGGYSASVHLQAAVRECVHNKFPTGAVPVVIPTSPDLAIVQGATHFVSLRNPQIKPTNSSVHWPWSRNSTSNSTVSGAAYFGAPSFSTITAPSSYGILTADVPGLRIPTCFEAFIVKGLSYGIDYKTERNFSVERGKQFRLAIGSSPIPEIRPGQNRLDAIGGLQAIQQAEKCEVNCPSAAQAGQGFLCCMTSTSNQHTANIMVEFCVRGIDLHVRVLSETNAILMQQAVRFLSGVGA